MSTFYDPNRQNPTYRNGSEHIESRLAKLEVHCWHESQAREAAEQRARSDLTWTIRQIEAVRKEIEEMQADRMALMMRVGAWLITSLVGALGLFVYDILKAGLAAG